MASIQSVEHDEKKNDNIQILRGLSIVAVVLIHNTPGGIAQVLCRPFLNFCVGLFLFLSAMLSNAEEWKPLKRIKKVVVPYIIWTTIYVVMSNYDSLSSIPIILIKQILTANAAAPLYYVFVYCEFTLLIPLIDKLARSKYKHLGFIVTPLEIVFMRLLPLVYKIEINHYVSIIKGVSCLGWFTYYYLGYLLGNGLIEVKTKTRQLIISLPIAIGLQIAEGYWYFCMGEANCGTQLKLSSILTGVIFAVLAFRFAYSKTSSRLKFIRLLGDNSFGIFISHIAVMMALGKLPYYGNIIYPFNAAIVIVADIACIYLGKKVLGKYSKYLAL